MPYSTSHLIGKNTFYRKRMDFQLMNYPRLLASAHKQQSRYERGVNRITLDRLFQYATYFEIDIKTFFQSHDF